MAEDLIWNDLCARAQANKQQNLVRSILISGLEARYLRNVKDELPVLQHLLLEALDHAEKTGDKALPVTRAYPAEVVEKDKRAFILYLNRKLPEPFHAWDASTDGVFQYQVGCYSPNDGLELNEATFAKTVRKDAKKR